MPQQTQIKRVIELGVAQVNNNARDLGLAVAALAQEAARSRVQALRPTALTDNSTGVAAASLAAVVTPTVAAQDGSTLLAPKAGFDTQIGLIEDAHRELVIKANEFIDLIVPNSTVRVVQDITAGAGPDDTIAAITPLLTGVTAAGSGVEDASGIAQIVNARNNGSAICAAINYARIAQGLPPIADGSGGIFNTSATQYETADAAATDAAAGAGENSLTEATVEAALTALTNNIATMAAAINENSNEIGPFVVATHNPRTRFAEGDTSTA